MVFNPFLHTSVYIHTISFHSTVNFSSCSTSALGQALHNTLGLDWHSSMSFRTPYPHFCTPPLRMVDPSFPPVLLGLHYCSWNSFCTTHPSPFRHSFTGRALLSPHGCSSVRIGTQKYHYPRITLSLGAPPLDWALLNHCWCSTA
jgi:hypothetical protein